jgi:hypothetical protein
MVILKITSILREHKEEIGWHLELLIYGHALCIYVPFGFECKL